jgi:hypothetical protein
MYSKQDQTKWNKTKEKPSMKNKKKERNYDYMEWFSKQSFQCFVCGTFVGVQGHHIKERSTAPKIDENLLPLCVEHHLGSTLSPHGTPNLFREFYPYDLQVECSKVYYKKYQKEKNKC